jgi:DNA-binding response OmpR family regulator
LPTTRSVLVVDDEPHIRDLVRLYMKREGFEVREAADGEAGLASARETPPDLIILDLMLPRLDGWEVCRELRRQSMVPIIMLTARDDEADRVLGLEMGADDYLTKPFSPRELVARVRAVLRRSSPATSGPNGAEGPESRRQRLEFPGFFIDLTGRELGVGNERVPCPAKEFELLWLLASNPNRVFTREQLLRQVWDYDYFGDFRTVDVHVRRIREKIEADPSSPVYLKTVWGVGYKFERP